MSAEFANGSHTDITITDDAVHKVIGYDLEPEVAGRLADHLEQYVAAFEDEPIDVAPLRDVRVSRDSSGGHHVEYTNQLCNGPHLSRLPGEDMQPALGRVLGQIANMSQLDDSGTLRVPLDAATDNFCVEDTGSVLVDIFPPLLRHNDGSFPFEDVPYSFSEIRQRMLAYRLGTVEGATLQMLFTSVRGATLGQQVLRSVRRVDDWCYDVIPPTLSDDSKAAIRRQLHSRFLPYLMRLGVAEGTGRLYKPLGTEPYESNGLGSTGSGD